MSVGDPGWPYDWDWTEEGVPTQLVEQVGTSCSRVIWSCGKAEIKFCPPFQSCPYGQNGTAFWRCGEDGDWEGYPDLSDCRFVRQAF